MYLSYRWPARFIFENLDIMWLYTMYNAIISCLAVVIIYGIKNRNIKLFKIATVGLCSLIIGAIVLYITYDLENLRHVCVPLATFLPLTMGILAVSEFVSESVSDKVSTIPTLYKNGHSSAPGSAASSGSKAAESGSGSDSEAAESRTRLPSFAGLLASI